MLTKIGKNILAKYLIGQTTSYASHIALGCGPRALDSDDVAGEYTEKNRLDFEMFRIPIISRGYVSVPVLDEDGQVQVDENDEPISISQIVFTGQLPTTERYEITEIGIYPAVSNPSSSNNGSRVLSSFSQTENWEYHSSTSIVSPASYLDALDKVNGVVPADPGTGNLLSGSINVPDAVFFANSDNSILASDTRISKNQRPRFLNNSLFLRGDLSAISGTGNNLSPTNSSSAHIHLNNINYILNQNSGQDEISIAFSVINKNDNTNNPTAVKLIVEFATSDDLSTAEYARLSYNITDGLASNRYFVKTSKLQDTVKSSLFSWGQVKTLKVYASVENSGGQTSDYYVALDGLRIENTTAQNPLYGLVGYTQIRTNNGRPIVKSDRSNNLVEFRFGLDV
jgi:hypothetical protein